MTQGILLEKKEFIFELRGTRNGYRTDIIRG